MYKFTTYAIIVNLLLSGCSSSSDSETYDGYSERPASVEGQVPLDIPTE